MTRVQAWVRRRVAETQVVLTVAADGWAESLLIALRDARYAGRPAHRTVLTLGVAS